MSINSVNAQTRLPQNQDPDAYAQQYANQNGISLDEAKAELKAKFGDPSKPQDIKNNANANLFDTDIKTSEDSLATLDDIDFSELDNVDFSSIDTTALVDFVKNTFQQLMTLLKGGEGPQKEGDPDMKSGAANSKDKQEKLPESKDDRDAYAQKYADENGISLDEAKEILASKEPKKVSQEA